MDGDIHRAQELIEHPRESLTIELKQWLDPAIPSELAKIVKACIALRNNNGGFLLIGVADKSRQPAPPSTPIDVRSVFHADRIQGAVAKYASELFEVFVHFPSLDEQEYPVIEIPSGVMYPVAAKADLPDPERRNKNLITRDRVYVRSLSSNNTPSTTEAKYGDWPHIVERCFENREADIGRFLARHLGNVNPQHLRDFAVEFARRVHSSEKPHEPLDSLLEIGEDRFVAQLKERDIGDEGYGSWEVACVVVGEVREYSPNNSFLSLLMSSNPELTGWPAWIDSRAFHEEVDRPVVMHGAWEALIRSMEGVAKHFDFWRIEPVGRFYQWRALQDDIAPHAVEPHTSLDHGLVTLRIGEAISVAIGFAKTMACEPHETQLAFRFRWKGLKGRQLCAWANPRRDIMPGKVAHQDIVCSDIVVPLDLSSSVLAQSVHEATKPLFEVFKGFEVDLRVTQDLIQRLINRQL